jgi:predicted metal-dependent phosphoesterase TrpH
VRGAGGYLAQAHPYRTGWWIQHPGPVAPSLIDGVEVYNAGNWEPSANGKALNFARRHRLPMQSGTDSHETGHPFYSGIELFKKAESIHDIIHAIQTKQTRLIMP